eukprot:FN608694.1.p2 GENE.FN608694.1~~FN608694.1.p2  ORF type:complete len:51 (+),score=7.87 FN608694.1:3-155(+)
MEERKYPERMDNRVSMFEKEMPASNHDDDAYPAEELKEETKDEGRLAPDS